MSITYLEDKDIEKWNNFVHLSPHGTFFHRAEWKNVIEDAFGFKCFYLMLKEAEDISAILPLSLVNRPLFGKALISTPLCVYGGAIGSKTEVLEEQAKKIARELNVKFLELRSETKENGSDGGNCSFFTFKKLLSKTHDENLKSIPRKQRAEVRKAIKLGLETQVNHDIDTFYKIYSRSVRNLGTPVFSKKYLFSLLRYFSDEIEITTAKAEDKALTSVLSFKYKNQILPYYGGGIEEARNYSAFPFMYWKVMENAVDQGLDMFDFGRSMKDSGAFSFKKNFGFEPVPLNYKYHLINASQMPDLDPDSARNKMITSIWKKVPLPIANMAGPILFPVVM